MFNVQSKS